MRVLPLVISVLPALAGCKPETARPQPAPEQAPARPVEERDAGADGEPMSAQEARASATAAAARQRGILEVLGEADRGGAKNVLTPGEDFSDEEIEAIEKALGTLEKKPPPPLAPE
jgi:hypothetical protein